MRALEGQLEQLGPWPKGANNLAAEHSVPEASFRQGVNVVVADDGKVSRRDGYTKVIDATEPHSLFSSGRRGFFVETGVLYGCELYDNGTLSVPISLWTGIAPDTRLAYCLIEPDIFVSDNTVSLRISSMNVTTEWALSAPQAPVATVTTPGELQAGTYQFALAYKGATGEESPLSTFTQVVVPTDGATVTLTALMAAPSGAYRTLIYMTKPNGTELLLFNSIPAATLTASVTKTRLGRPSPTEGLEPMPPGQFAAYFAGRLLVASDDAVWWSEPMHYALTSLEYNFTLFSEPVTGIGVVGETTGGFFVGQQSRVYFVRGDNPAEAQLQEVYPAGMVPGTLTHVPGARLPLESPPTVPVPVWLATNGVFCAGLQDGSVLPLTEPRYAADVGVDGASIFIQQGGVNRLVATTRAPADNVFAVSDSVSITVVRNGITP